MANFWRDMVEKLFLWRLNILRKLRFPIWGERRPFSWDDTRTNMVTLLCLVPQVIPGHAQKCKDSFQEFRIPRWSSVTWALKASNESLSVVLSPRTAENAATASRTACNQNTTQAMLPVLIFEQISNMREQDQ